MSRLCECGAALYRGTKGTRCRPCYEAALAAKRSPHVNCSECGMKLGRGNQTGLCRPHQTAKINADPVIMARRVKAAADASRRPDMRAKRAEIQRRNAQKPEVRANLSAHAKRNHHLALGSEKAIAARKAPDAMARRGRTRSENMLAWCPPEYREEYRWLNTRAHILKPEAKRMILEKVALDEARRIGAMTDFERQLEAVKNGRGLVAKPVLRSRDYDFTLGGVTDL